MNDIGKYVGNSFLLNERKNIRNILDISSNTSFSVHDPPTLLTPPPPTHSLHLPLSALRFLGDSFGGFPFLPRRQWISPAHTRLLSSSSSSSCDDDGDDDDVDATGGGRDDDVNDDDGSLRVGDGSSGRNSPQQKRHHIPQTQRSRRRA